MSIPPFAVLFGSHPAAGGGGGAVDLSYLTSNESTSGLTTYTFSSQSFGTADAGRYIVVGIGAPSNNAGRTISTVTLGGVSATNAVTAIGTGGGSDIASLYIANVPTGTTGDVVITFSAAMLRCGIGLWRMTGLGSATPHDTMTDIVRTGSVWEGTIDCPADGAIIGMSWQRVDAGTGSVTWAGITEDFDDTVASAVQNYSGASSEFVSTQTGLTVSITQAGTPQYGALAAASWGP